MHRDCVSDFGRRVPSRKSNKIAMSKLYVGNLPQDASEQALRQLLDDNGITSGGILVKRGGYAFIDCPDQSAADKAIDKLNGEYRPGRGGAPAGGVVGRER